MKHLTLFGVLLENTYTASGTSEPIERYYATMFSSFYDQSDSQPGCTAVMAIVRGTREASRKLLGHYRDPDQPRCPRKLKEDLTSLANCCFADAARRDALHHALETFVQIIPAADAEDLRRTMGKDNLIQMWTYLTWYAMCSDHHGTASY